MPNTLGPALNTYFGGNLKSANPGYIIFDQKLPVVQDLFKILSLYPAFIFWKVTFSVGLLKISPFAS